MGAKTWMLVYAGEDPASVLRSGPALDRDAARRVAEALYPGRLREFADGTLFDDPSPPDGHLYVGAYPGLTVVCDPAVALDRPSTLPARFLGAAPGPRVVLHAMHSGVDWFAYAIWVDGRLVRALSLSPDDGIMENFGAALDFEAPYWAGERRVEEDDEDADADPYPLPFHPLELAEDALAGLFGFVYEGMPPPDEPDLEAVVLAGFRYA